MSRNNTRTGILRFGTLCVLFCALLLFLPVRAEAASSKTKALKAYKKFLAQSTMTWGEGSSTTVTLSKCRFAVVYLDKNSVPELILYAGSNSVDGSDGSYLIYTYKNGRVTFVARAWESFSYYKKKGVYLTSHRWNGYYYTFSSATAVRRFSVTDETVSYYDINGDGEYSLVYKRFADATDSTGTVISKSAFNSQLKSLIGSKKLTTPKFRKNTAANRKKYLK
ncbi:MAG: hypothetical protein LUI13_02620 [Lachnospiraceae bacterium]|nr:hypothetical protein [Lachnospiraceae bacterium]